MRSPFVLLVSLSLLGCFESRLPGSGTVEPDASIVDAIGSPDVFDASLRDVAADSSPPPDVAADSSSPGDVSTPIDTGVPFDAGSLCSEDFFLDCEADFRVGMCDPRYEAYLVATYESRLRGGMTVRVERSRPVRLFFSSYEAADIVIQDPNNVVTDVIVRTYSSQRGASISFETGGVGARTIWESLELDNAAYIDCNAPADDGCRNYGARMAPYFGGERQELGAVMGCYGPGRIVIR